MVDRPLKPNDTSGHTYDGPTGNPEDRPLYPDHTKIKEVVKSCEILREVEKEVGSLG